MGVKARKTYLPVLTCNNRFVIGNQAPNKNGRANALWFSCDQQGDSFKYRKGNVKEEFVRLGI